MSALSVEVIEQNELNGMQYSIIRMQSFLECKRPGWLAKVHTASLFCGVSILTESEILSKQSLTDFFAYFSSSMF